MRLGSGKQIAPKGILEVRKPDGTILFTTPVEVSTESATALSSSEIDATASLDSLGAADSVDVYIHYRESGSDTWQSTPADTLTTTGQHTDSITGLSSGTEYELQAVANGDNGTTDTGSTLTATTEVAASSELVTASDSPTTYDKDTLGSVNSNTISNAVTDLAYDNSTGKLIGAEEYGSKVYKIDYSTLSVDSTDTPLNVSEAGGVAVDDNGYAYVTAFDSNSDGVLIKYDISTLSEVNRITVSDSYSQNAPAVYGNIEIVDGSIYVAHYDARTAQKLGLDLSVDWEYTHDDDLEGITHGANGKTYIGDDSKQFHDITGGTLNATNEPSGGSQIPSLTYIDSVPALYLAETGQEKVVKADPDTLTIEATTTVQYLTNVINLGGRLFAGGTQDIYELDVSDLSTINSASVSETVLSLNAGS